MAVTNRGAKRINDIVFRGATPPTNFYVALFTNAVVPTVDTNTKSELTEIPTGNGYTAGGFQLARNSTDFDTSTEDDTNDRALVQVKDVVWTASGGPIPSSGAAFWAALTDDNATLGSRDVFAFWALGSGSGVSVTVGQPLTLQDLEFRGTTV